jgi:hypothetical protein
MEFDLQADQQGFIGLRVAPVIDVRLAAGPFGRVPLSELLKSPETRRASGAGYSRGKYKFTTDSYACEENGHEVPIDNREAHLYMDYIDQETAAAMLARDVVLRAYEKRVRDLLFDPVVYTGAELTTGVSNEWDDPTNATPIADVEHAVQTIHAQCGLWANCIVMGRKVFRNLRNCDDIIERVSSSGAGSPSKATDITAQMLAQVFDLTYVLVGGGVDNLSSEGVDPVLADIWDDEYVSVCRVAVGRDHKEPCVLRTFHWSADGSNIGATIESYRDETIRADVIRARHDTDEKRLIVEAAHLLSNITS